MAANIFSIVASCNINCSLVPYSAISVGAIGYRFYSLHARRLTLTKSQKSRDILSAYPTNRLYTDGVLLYSMCLSAPACERKRSQESSRTVIERSVKGEEKSRLGWGSGGRYLAPGIGTA